MNQGYLEYFSEVNIMQDYHCLFPQSILWCHCQNLELARLNLAWLSIAFYFIFLSYANARKLETLHSIQSISLNIY